MKKAMQMVPLAFLPGCRASKVSLVERLTNMFLGAPNARRANNVVSTRLDLCGAVSGIISRFSGRRRSAPVYEIDRIGNMSREGLPRIWLSEVVSNTNHDDGRRMFVECYPTAPDRGGERALELGDRYLGEGLNVRNGLSEDTRKECFKAAEILYRHAVRRGSRTAATRLFDMYSDDLCEGEYWSTYLEEHARHARRESPAWSGHDLSLCA